MKIYFMKAIHILQKNLAEATVLLWFKMVIEIISYIVIFTVVSDSSAERK